MMPNDMARRLAAAEHDVAEQGILLTMALNRISTLEGTATGFMIGCNVLATALEAQAPEFSIGSRLKERIATIEAMPAMPGRDAALTVLRNLLLREAPRPRTFGVIEGGRAE